MVVLLDCLSPRTKEKLFVSCICLLARVVLKFKNSMITRRKRKVKILAKDDDMLIYMNRTIMRTFVLGVEMDIFTLATCFYRPQRIRPFNGYVIKKVN